MTDAPPPAAPRGTSHLWIDASAGVAGDMVLGALVDAGADLRAVQSVVDAVLPGTVRLAATEVTRAGMRACQVDVSVLAEDQAHRTWRDIRVRLTQAAVPALVRTRSLEAFRLLADAEARVHGVDVDDVHFHEVGAWDSVADVVGVAAALHLLGVESISAGPVALGSGRTRTAHGDVPVPSPATLQLAAGWTVHSGGDGELATPTGMALVRALSGRCEELPPMQVGAIGLGAGTEDTPGRPNVVRAVLGRATDSTPDREQLWVLETNVDDLDPRVWPGVLGALLGAGAADAWLTPILMKKGRPAHTLSVLSGAAARAALRDLMFAVTTTFGVREHRVERTALGRDWYPVAVDGHTVRIKVAVGADGRIRHATPEFDDAAAVAARTGLPARQVLDDASAAARQAGLTVGAEPPAR